jgi:predicted O-linked N-acetylglucosamine transferase (SPINDLY family)
MRPDMYDASDSKTALTLLGDDLIGSLSVGDLIKAAEMRKASLNAQAAVELYDAWIRRNGAHPFLHAVLFNASVLLSEAGALERARALLEQAIATNPDFIPAHINLGRIYERMGGTGLAVIQWSNAIDRLSAITGTSISHKITALNQMARVLEGANRDAAAEATLRQSLDLDPHQREPLQHLLALRQRQCEWPVIAPLERLDTRTQLKGMSPLSLAAYTDDPMLQLASAWSYSLRETGAPAPIVRPPAAKDSGSDGRLKIGYVSSDLRHHAIGFLTAEVYGLHDRSKVEVFAYYCGPDLPDPLQARIKSEVDHWVPISGLDDEQAARRIAEDGIQILVDVNGYTRDGRVKLFALRPAPVIVNWLGFPGSTGSPYHHYLVADDWIVPPESEIFYSEKVLRLPCYQPNDRRRIVSSRRPTRAEAGLPEEAVVYCCFNGVHKLNRFTLDRWLAILSQTPGAVLWLLDGGGTANAQLHDYAKARGVDPRRIVFAAKQANPDHLARYPLADVFLDTTPYGAHTTASDALWMGVPVVTLSGRSFASRVCGSLVRSAGLPELVCDTPEAFVARAVALGNDAEMRKGFQQRLSETRDSSVLFDTPGLVRSLEELYRSMWSDYERGELPRPDLANLDVYLEVGAEQPHEEVEVRSIGAYEEWWRSNLAARHARRPFPNDRRFWPEPREAGKGRGR